MKFNQNSKLSFNTKHCLDCFERKELEIEINIKVLNGLKS